MEKDYIISLPEDKVLNVSMLRQFDNAITGFDGEYCLVNIKNQLGTLEKGYYLYVAELYNSKFTDVEEVIKDVFKVKELNSVDYDYYCSSDSWHDDFVDILNNISSNGECIYQR